MGTRVQHEHKYVPEQLTSGVLIGGMLPKYANVCVEMKIKGRKPEPSQWHLAPEDASEQLRFVQDDRCIYTSDQNEQILFSVDSYIWGRLKGLATTLETHGHSERTDISTLSSTTI